MRDILRDLMRALRWAFRPTLGRMLLLAWLVLAIVRPGGIVSYPWAVILGVTGIYRLGVERRRDDRLPARFVKFWWIIPGRSLPLVAVLGAVLLQFTPGSSGQSWTGILYVAAALTAYRLGLRGPGVEGYRRDLVYGATGWLVGQTLAVAAVPLAHGGVLVLAATVIMTATIAVALREEPLHVMPDAILAHRARLNREARRATLRMVP